MNKKDKEFLKKVGANIAKERKARGLSQVDVCSELDMDKPYLSSIENGRQNPTLLTLKKIADEIDIKVSELIKY